MKDVRLYLGQTNPTKWRAFMKRTGLNYRKRGGSYRRLTDEDVKEILRAYHVMVQSGPQRRG